MHPADSADFTIAPTPARDLSRRELLAIVGAGAVAAAAAVLAPNALGAESTRGVRGATPMPATPRVTAFPLADVRLLDGPFHDAQQRDERYLLALQPDRLLHNFRVNAGLTPKAPVYGGWESEEPWVEIRCHGHTLGHYLSAVSLMYAATGDARFKERVDYIVDELRACQDASGTGLICAFPDGSTQLDNSVSGKPFVGVPWYTMHKIFTGLRDAHVQAGSMPARAVLVKLSDWTWNATRGLSDEQFQRMLGREHGGMNEVLADASALANDPRYLTLARQFSHRALLTPLTERRDTLDGLHANTQIPKVIGFQRLYEMTGEPGYLAASRFFWDTVVQRRSFATGGHGDNEHFVPPNEFAAHLGSATTMETCCTHNMLRLTRMLFAQEPSAIYADYYERALYNGILASQDPTSGMMTYFQATRPGYVRLYHTPDESFWCCTGTGMENHAKYGDSIYFKSADAMYVNLFVPSVATWRERALTVRQTTRFPDTDATRLTVTADRPARATIHVRHPSWSSAMTVAVNGRRWPAAAAPNGYVAIDREWRTGDVVDVHLPMTLRTETLPGTTNTVAFLYGPIVLAGRLGQAGIEPGADIIKNERTSGTMLNDPVDVPVLVGDVASLTQRVRRSPGDALAFRTAGLARPRDVELVPYHRVAHERYTIYWKVTA